MVSAKTSRGGGLENTRPLPVAVSLLLDVTRFCLAALVAVGHLTEINPRLPNLMPISHGAGPLFFVLSGFLIRFVTKMREHTMRDFFLDRFSKMYSVVLPAVLWTLLCDLAAAHLDRTTYLSLAGNYLHWAGIRIFLNVFFLSAAWGLDTHMLSNAPFWTLSYEVPYYLMFGFAVFLQGRTRIVCLALLALLIGPQVISLAPLWLLGVLLYDVYQRIRFDDGQRRFALAMCVLLLAATARLWPWLAHRRNPILALMHLPEVRAEMWRYAVVLPFTLALFAAILLIDRIRMQPHGRVLMFARSVANGTFVVYLFHYPALLLGRTMGLMTSKASSVLFFAGTVMVLTACAPATDRLKIWIRKRVPRLLEQNAAWPLRTRIGRLPAAPVLRQQAVAEVE